MSDWFEDAWNDAEFRLSDIREECSLGNTCGAFLKFDGRYGCNRCGRDFEREERGYD